MYCVTYFYADKKLEELKKKSKQRAKPRQAVPDQGSDDDKEVGQKAVSLDTTSDYKKQLLILLQEGTKNTSLFHSVHVVGYYLFSFTTVILVLLYCPPKSHYSPL